MPARHSDLHPPSNPKAGKRKGGLGRRVLLPKPTHPVMAQRLFWLFRVVTSLFIGAVILGECEAQLSQAVPPSHLVPSAAGLASPCFLRAASASGWSSTPAHMPPSLWPYPLTFTPAQRRVGPGKPSWTHLSNQHNIFIQRKADQNECLWGEGLWIMEGGNGGGAACFALRIRQVGEIKSQR